MKSLLRLGKLHRLKENVMSNKIQVECKDGMTEPSWISSVSPFVEKVLAYLEIDQWELSVLFCDDPFIRNLNNEYRKIDAPTDVLSFEQGDEYIDEDDVTWFNAGDIVISLDSLQANSQYFNETPNVELKRLLIHGILHLDGQDHENNDSDQEMLQLQERILLFFINDIVFKE